MTIGWMHSVAYFFGGDFFELGERIMREEYERGEVHGLMIPFLRDRCINGA